MVDKIELPVIIPNKLLISPGIWNDNEYTAKEINEAFAKTAWEDKTKISLWLNHEDKNANAFIGYIKNPKLVSEGKVFGDLELWDEKTATILTQAMAKFGISAKIKGEEDEKGKMNGFTFENFSVVTIPACSDAYINLAKKEKKLVSKYLISDKDIDEMLGDDEAEDEDEKDFKGNEFKSLSDIDERRLNMAEEEKKEEEKTEEPGEKELSEKEMLRELSVKFDKLISLLSKKLEEEKPEETAPEEAPKEAEAPAEAPKEPEAEAPKEPVEKENKELTTVKKELAEIKEKLNAPKSKTIRNLSSNTVGDEAKFDVNTFCDLLTGIEKPMKFI